MALSGSVRRLMVIVDEDARFNHKPLFMEIVRRARDAGLAGASAFRGVEGFGPSHHLHTNRILSLDEDMPVMIIIIDTAVNIDRFAPQLAELMMGGIIALDDVEVLAPATSR
jgi:uncharacterized protein